MIVQLCPAQWKTLRGGLRSRSSIWSPSRAPGLKQKPLEKKKRLATDRAPLDPERSQISDSQQRSGADEKLRALFRCHSQCGPCPASREKALACTYFTGHTHVARRHLRYVTKMKTLNCWLRRTAGPTVASRFSSRRASLLGQLARQERRPRFGSAFKSRHSMSFEGAVVLFSCMCFFCSSGSRSLAG